MLEQFVDHVELQTSTIELKGKPIGGPLYIIHKNKREIILYRRMFMVVTTQTPMP